MADRNNEYRMTDKELQDYANNVLWDYEVMVSRGVYTVNQTPLAVRELVLRELERRQKREGENDA